MEGCRPRAVFMAFGTKGDVLPIAALATALACDQQRYHVVLITHLAHQSLCGHLSAKNVSYIPVLSPPVLPVHTDGFASDSAYLSFSLRKKAIQKEHRQECLSTIGRVFGDGPSMEGDFIVINFFALEGWNLAELFQVRCVIAAPYVVPYSAPSSFERQFKQELPLLYKYFYDAPANKVCWKDVAHWMWPLFTEDWGSYRSDCLNLSPYPFTEYSQYTVVVDLEVEVALITTAGSSYKSSHVAFAGTITFIVVSNAKFDGKNNLGLWQVLKGPSGKPTEMDQSDWEEYDL